MNGATLLAVLGVLSAWGVVLFSIWRWGPGRAKRSVLCPEKQLRAKLVVEQREGNLGSLLVSDAVAGLCPEKQLRAKLVVEQREGDFGCLRVTDVVACSLLPGGPLSCGKECLSRF